MTDNVRDPIDPFETRLMRLVLAYTAASDVAIDAGAIARDAAARPQARFGGLRWTILVAGLAVALALALAVGYGAFRATAVPLLVTAGANIVAVDPDTGQRHELGPGTDPVWSPDRTRIAFQLGDSTWLMNRDGTQRQALSADLASGTFTGPPVWAADGKHVLVAAFELALVGVDDSSARDLGYATWKDGGTGSLSPDGSRIAVVLASGILVADLSTSGSAPSLIRGGPNLPWLPRWSPTGTRLAYADNGGIHTVNADGSDNRLYRGDVSGRTVDSLAWSPDGTHLAYTARATNAYVIDTTTGTTVALMPPTAGAAFTSVAWSRDGTRLGVVVGDAAPDGPGSVALWIVDIDGTSARELMTGIDPIWDRGPDWW